MATRTSIQRICGSLACFGLAVCLSSVVLAQGDEEMGDSSTASAQRNLGGVFQKFFSPRERPATSESSSSASSPRGFKPGAFRGGVIRQLKAITDPSSPSDVVVEEESKANNPPTGTVPKAPSQMARRPSREPFADVRASQDSTPAPPSRSQSQSSAIPRMPDVFDADPPSIVGTGVSPSQLQSQMRSQEMSKSPAPIVSSRDLASREKPNASAPATSATSSSTTSSRSKAPVDEVDLDVPKVSRRTVPPTQVTSKPPTASPTAPSANSSQASRPNTYAIPGSPYNVASPNATSSMNSPNRYSGAQTKLNDPNVAVSKSTPSSTSGTTTSIAPDKQTSTPSSNVASSSSTAARGETRLDMSIPKVRLFVSGPSSLQVGRAVPYEVFVRNEGSEMLTGVIVSMVVPNFVKPSLPVATSGEFQMEKDESGTDVLLWHVTDLGPAQSKVFRISLEATKAEHFAVDLEWTVLPQSSQIQIAVQQPQLQVGIEGPSKVLWGKPEIYRLRVRNPGNADVKDVQVRLNAESYGSNQSKIGDVAAGSEKIVEVELTFQQTGTIKLSGSAESSVMSLQSTSSIEVEVDQIKLASQWSGPSLQYQGSIAEHRLTVTNQSKAPASDVRCIATIPAGFKAISMPPGATIDGSTIKWTLDKLEPGASQPFSFGLQALTTGETSLKCAIESFGGGQSSHERLVQVESLADLKLTVSDPIAPAPVGEDVIYDLTIVNRGSKAATDVQILAQFSNGIEPVRSEGGASKVLPGQVIFEPIERIEAGQELTVRVVARASEEGMHRFRAELQCENGETQLVQEESTRYLATTKNDSQPNIRR